MPRAVFILALACTVAVAGCGGGGPTGPTPKVPRISRTRFLAFGDSLTSGEVTAPIAAGDRIGKLIVVASAAYPTVLQSQLQAAYPSQSSAIAVSNQGRGGETIFDGVRRFAEVFPESRAEVVLLQEGVNGLGTGGPDASTALMRVMVQQAKGTNAKVFIPGQSGGDTISMAGPYDVTIHTQLTALQSAGSLAGFLFGPGGSVASQARSAGSAYVTQYNVSTTAAGRVEYSATLMITGAVTNNTF